MTSIPRSLLRGYHMGTVKIDPLNPAPCGGDLLFLYAHATNKI